MIVSDEVLEAALHRLSELDEKEAELRAAKEFGDAKAKEIFSRHFLTAEGTVAERDAKARTNDEYKKHLIDLRTVTKNHQAAKNERDRLTMLKEVWQSEQANERQRN